MSARRRIFLALLLLASTSVAGLAVQPRQTSHAATSQLQVATGEMLGTGYNKRWFYVSIDGGGWQPTYNGTAFKTAARGKLMNFRAANAIFDDENRTDDNPDANTASFISWMDSYAAHNVLAYTVSLQGGNPGYDGGLVSAFRSDGTLKQAWLDRAGRVIEAARARNQVVILTYFYQRQDERLANDTAVRAGVRNATDWLISRNYRNVVIEIVNEYDSSYVDRTILKTNSASGGIAELINLAKSRFAGQPYRLPVSASSRTSDPAAQTGALRDAADLVLIHGPVTNPTTDGTNTATLVGDSNQHGPVVMNEDRQGGTSGVTATDSGLAAERASATNVFNAGGSWGLSWQSYNQIFPFKWAVGSGTSVAGDNKANYFHAVLDHIRSLTSTTAHPGTSPSPSPSTSTSTTPTPTPTPTPTASPTPTTSPPTHGVVSFTLINTNTDLPVAGFDPVPAGAVIDKSDLGTGSLSLRANTTGAVGSVRWSLNATANYRTENSAPYALGGDQAGDFATWTLANGVHTVKAATYSASSAGGARGGEGSVTFTLRD